MIKAVLALTLASSASAYAFSKTSAEAEGATIPWDHSTPDKWAEGYPACGGMSQSPIDLPSPATFEKYIEDRVAKIAVYSDGITRKVNYRNTGKVGPEGTTAGSALQVDLLEYGVTMSSEGSGGELQLLQMHFHTGSEHTFEGQQMDLVAHNVFLDVDLYDGGKGPMRLAVVGLLFKIGAKNDWLDPLLSGDFDLSVGQSQEVDFAWPETPTWADLVSGKFMEYEGSLTTPPCSEVVHWMVNSHVFEISQAQYDWAKSHGADLAANFRPVMPRNGRHITGTTYIAVSKAELAATPAPAATISPNGGEHISSVEISIAGPLGCHLFYTLDGSVPNMNSRQYTGPFVVNTPGFTTVKAVSQCKGWAMSEPVSTIFNVFGGGSSGGSGHGDRSVSNVVNINMGECRQ